jgi:hypothetical protein
MAVKNTLAYYDTVTITASKMFTVQAQGKEKIQKMISLLEICLKKILFLSLFFLSFFLIMLSSSILNSIKLIKIVFVQNDQIKKKVWIKLRKIGTCCTRETQW